MQGNHPQTKHLTTNETQLYDQQRQQQEYNDASKSFYAAENSQGQNEDKGAKTKSDLLTVLVDLLGQETLEDFGFPNEEADRILIKILTAAGLAVLTLFIFVDF